VFNLSDEEEDTRLLVKTLPSKHTPALPIQEEVSTTVVYDLLNCLIRLTPYEDSTLASSAGQNAGLPGPSGVAGNDTPGRTSKLSQAGDGVVRLQLYSEQSKGCTPLLRNYCTVQGHPED
jgi:hypothetical protein